MGLGRPSQVPQEVAAVIFFVIAVPEASEHKAALKYLKGVGKRLRDHGESPFFGVLLHKVDPMIREKPETRETVADLEARCARALEGFDF